MFKNLVLFTLLICITILFIFTNCAYNPVTGKKELTFMTESMEAKTGEDYYPIYTQLSNGLHPDQALQDYVSAVGNKLIEHPHRRNFKYEFNVLNSSVPNAYALPGGKVSITRGLLVKMQNEDQLAGVLGHEIGHINARHSAERYTKTLITQAALLAGSYYLSKKNVKFSEAYIAGGFFGSQLLLMRYSRDNEREADKLGLEYMTGSGYNPQGYVELMEILQSLHSREPSKWETLFSTHPLTSERITDAKNRLTSVYQEQTAARPLKTNEFNFALRNLKNSEKAYTAFDEGMALFEKKDYAASEKKFNEAVSLYNKDALFHAYSAYAKSKQNNHRQALTSAQTAVSIYPEFYIGRIIKGIIHTELKDYKNALTELQNAAKLVGGSATGYFYMARSYDGLNDINNAVANYRKVLESTEDKEMVDYSKMRLNILAPEPPKTEENADEKKT